MNSRLVRRLLIIAALALPAGVATAQESDIPLLHSGTDINDLDSLQRGARNFMNYCSGCHSLKYVRLNRLGQDLRIPESELGSLMFTAEKTSDTINSSMPKDSEAWFGKQPPDLSLIARAKGTDYIYSLFHG